MLYKEVEKIRQMQSYVCSILFDAREMIQSWKQQLATSRRNTTNLKILQQINSD